MMSVNGVLVAISHSPIVSLLVKVTVTTALSLTIARLARHSRAALRHLVLLAGFGILLVLPAASIAIPPVSVAVSTARQEPPASARDIVSDDSGSAPGQARGPGNRAPARSRPETVSAPSLLAIAWALGTSICLLPVVLGLAEIRRLRRSAAPWTMSKRSIPGHAGGRRVDLLLHGSIPGPMTCGLVRPVILLPAEAVTWPADDLDRALVHEVEHVRRADWATQCLVRIVCAAYWFHPLVWMARWRLVLEAERACDDAVLRRSDAAAYADQLVSLARRLSAEANLPLLAMATRRDLSSRVVAVLDRHQRRGPAGIFPIALACAASAFVVSGVAPLRMVAASAQTNAGRGDQPTFEIVSIRPCAGAPGGGGRRVGGGGPSASPGRLHLECMTAVEMILRAYVQFGDPPPLNYPRPGPETIANAPAWARTDRYTVEAKAAGTPAPAMMTGAMLRSLLEDRFRLKLHEDSKEIAAYALTVAPSGFKLKAVPDDSCTPHDPATPLAGPGNGGRAIAPDGKPYCVGNVGGNGPNMTFDTTGQTLDRVCRTIGGLVLDRPVVNQTGIVGLFAFHVEFANEGNRLVPPGAQPVDPADPATAPSIFTVFEKQLGLKFVPTRTRQGFLVVDRVEPPSTQLASVIPASQATARIAR